MKKLLVFLMLAIPILAIVIVKLTSTVALGDVFISVENIVLSEDDIKAKVGDSIDLKYVIYPEYATNQEVIFASSDEQAAIVDEKGHVDFVGTGSGYISVTTKEGSKHSYCSFYVSDTKVHRVQLNYESTRLHVGGEMLISATVLPDEALNKEVVFTSSNEEIAKVEFGSVHGLKVGRVTITATSVDGGYSDSVDLDIINPVTSLYVASENETIVTANKNEFVEYYVLPEDATIKQVHCSLDNPEVAEITDEGYITFLKPGEVNITLTTEDGGFTKTVKYIYTANFVYDIIVTTPSITMNIDDEPIIIAYETLPENCDVEIVSEDENIAYVRSGCLYPVKGGSTTLTLKAYKNENEVVIKTIFVYITSPATDIEIEDSITAEKTFKLNPISLPEGSTNSTYFYEIINGVDFATITQDGLITFNTLTASTIKVRVWANENKSVFKDVNITYTAGKPYSFELIDDKLTLNYNETALINYNILPASARDILPKLEIVEGQEIVEILPDGRIRAIAGGKAKVKVSFSLYNGQVVEDYCNIIVIRTAEQIEINVDLDYYANQNQYVTSKSAVQFSGTVLPADTTDKNITWSVSDSNIAFIDNNTLRFNQVGAVTLTATSNKATKSIEIYYAGSNPVYAEVQAEIGGVKQDMPTSINVEETFNVSISKLIPSYDTLPELYLEVENAKTSSPLGKVLTIEGNTVSAVAGGTATLVVRISNSIKINYSITVVRQPKSITVMQANSKITTSSIKLIAEILPIDTTNKNVKFVVNNPSIATVDGTTLTFNTNGIANITAISLADERVRCNFTIEKIEKDTILASVQQNSISFNKGELLTFNDVENFAISVESETPTIAGEKVVRVENERYLRAVSSGQAKIKVTTSTGSYEIEISVKQPVENVILSSNIDFYNDEYVVASRVVSLNFNVLPAHASNKGVTASIKLTGGERIATINNNRITFIKAGVVTLEIKSDDGNYASMINLRYTGGVAVDAELNVGSRIVMNIGDKVTIDVKKWIPNDVVDPRFLFKEIISSSGKKIIDINDKTRTITAVEGGEARLILELSSGIIKEIEIVCINKVKDINVEQNVLISGASYTIEAEVEPSNATNSALEFELAPTDIATIKENVVTFKKAGTITVYVRSVDDPNVQKAVTITSTLGYLHHLELNETNITILKGEMHRIFVDGYPTDAKNNQIKYKILTESAYDKKSKVITLSDDGQIEALCAGTATVRVYALDYYNNEVYADCIVTVRSPLMSIDVQFESTLENYQNKTTFITSKNVVPFKIVYEPIDAEIENYSYNISNDSVAKIEDGKIIFLKTDRVSITFICTDFETTKSITYSFYYVGDRLHEATLNKTGFENNVINKLAGETVTFSLSKAVPSDNTNLEFTITNIAEKRNDPNKQVATFKNGVLYAENGGSFSFTLWVNGYKLENLTLVVTKNAVGIEVVDGDNFYVGIPSFSIDAHVLETDASQTKLGYRVKETGIASVNQNGDVTFNKFGVCHVEIYIVEIPSITKTITITYTKEVQSIVFNQMRDNIYTTDYFDFGISSVPLDAEKFSVDVTIDNEEIASLVKKDDIYRLIPIKSGKVTITATVVGKDIKATKTIEIFDKISDIKLSLDKTTDAHGHGEYRIFGNTFFNEKNELINTYKMGVTIIPADLSTSLLEWSSSNEQIATVDASGVVTFLTAGKVTITVKQKVPYPGAPVAIDSYEFNIVEGINVSSPAQFNLANAKLTEINKSRTENLASMVLNADILIDKGINSLLLNYSIYGNGYMLNFSNSISTWEHFIIRRNNVVIDNAVLRAVAISSGQELRNAGVVLMIENCNGILVYNTIIEHGETGIRLQCAQVDVVGCIIRNCLSAGIKVARSATVACNLRVKDTVFTSSYCGILYTADKFATPNLNTVTLEGEVWFYNYSTVDQLEKGLDLNKILRDAGLSLAANEIISQLEKIVADKGGSYACEYNGEKYYNFGILQFSADIRIAGITFDSFGILNKTALNSTCNYTIFDCVGALDMTLTTVPIKCNILSIQAKGAFIKPGESYVDNPNFWKIKQPCRF